MKEILLYGTSIFMAGLAAQLQNAPHLKVRCRADLSGLLDLGEIDTAVVDLDDGLAADVLALIRARPDLKIVGVNAGNNAVTVLSGRVYLAQTIADVVACLA
jgi:hypothetical protein